MNTNKNLSAAIIAAFKANPTADKLLVTTDCNCFVEKDKHHAEYHSRVSKTKLIEVNRDEYASELKESTINASEVGNTGTENGSTSTEGSDNTGNSGKKNKK
jgi:hypothetical protein